MVTVPKARFRLYFNETFLIHVALDIFYRLMSVHTFFGTLMMPLNLYFLFPAVLFVPVHTELNGEHIDTFGEAFMFRLCANIDWNVQNALLMHAHSVYA